MPLLIVVLAWWLALALPATASERFTSDSEAITQVLDLAATRLQLMPAVAAWKWQNQLPIADAERERVVIDKAALLAQGLGLAPEPVRKLFEVQIALSREAQAALHARWTRAGFDAAAEVRDLSAVRQQLDALTPALLRALYAAAAAISSQEFTVTQLPAADQRLQALGWDASSRERFLSALASLRRPQAPTLEQIRAAGVLRVGTTGDYAPFSDVSGGELSGVDIELAKRLAATLGVTPLFIRTSWPTLTDDLRASRFDIAMSGVSITPARQSVGTFSQAYATSGKTIIARCAEVARYADLAALDRAEVRVIVNPGGTNEQFVRAKLQRARVMVFPDNRTIFDEIVAGRADAMVTDDVEVELQTRRHRELCRTNPGTFTESRKAIWMSSDPRLATAVDGWLAGAIREAVPAKLLVQFLGN
jgi:cyclohexadienyl dehydratase